MSIKQFKQPWIKSLKVKVDKNTPTVSLVGGTEGESNTFTSCEFHSYVPKLYQGVTVTHLNTLGS